MIQQLYRLAIASFGVGSTALALLQRDFIAAIGAFFITLIFLDCEI